MPQPLKIQWNQQALEQLQQRLQQTRWPDEPDNEEWQYGTRLSYLRELCTDWQHCDWQAQEQRLNGFEHFTAAVDGHRLHFLHHKGRGASSIPLLLTHGWPDSFVRFLHLIPLLTEDVDGLSFDLVIPSIPGFGFSEIPPQSGMNPKKIAALFASLMQEELGYPKFLAQGGDWGGTITENLALYHSDALLGIHLTDVPFQHSLLPVKEPSPAEKKHLEETKAWQQKEGAYNQLQSTKPQTLAYGLTDSPAGLAAWITEKFYGWTDNQGRIEEAVSREDLLLNLTLYWTTGTINSANRLYYEAMQTLMRHQMNPLSALNPFDKMNDRTEVPAAFALFPKDLHQPPREFAERFFNVQRWSKMKRGGHFAALEAPEDLARDIREFASQLGKP